MTDTRRIVLLGKSGAGKSSLANTIFGENVFRKNNSPISGTKNCQSQTKSINGRRVTLIDTPGLFDTDPESPDLSPELLKCVTECAPGPHAFLLVLKVETFTRQEQAVIEIILKYFSEEALKYTTVVFSHGEDLPDGMKIEDWVSQSKALEDLVQKCDGRCHVFDNKHWNNTQDQYRNNKVQVEELLKTIDTTVIENRGEYFTNELLQQIQHEIEQEKQRIIESLQNLSEGQIRERARKSVYSKLLTNPVTIGVVLGAFLGALTVKLVPLSTFIYMVSGATAGAARFIGSLAVLFVKYKDRCAIM